MSQNYHKQSPVFYVLIAVLVLMSIGPVLLMFVNSFKLDVDITSGAQGCCFCQQSRITKQRFAISCGTSWNIAISAL